MNRELEQKFTDAVKKRGGFCVPFNNPGWVNALNCLVILPGLHGDNVIQSTGFVGFEQINYKRFDDLDKARKFEMDELAGTGVPCYVVEIEEKIQLVLDDIQLGTNPGIRYGGGQRTGVKPGDESIRNVLIPVVGIDKSYYYSAHPGLDINDATAIFVTDDGVKIRIEGDYPKVEKLLEQIRVFK